MSLPFFYIETIEDSSSNIILKEETSKHIVQVLRMQIGEQLQLTDGKGNLFTTEIIDDNRKKCGVKILHKSEILRPASIISIAISPVKNAGRFEWFLEKATEIGVSEIIPLLCERTEKLHFKLERMQGILISAMLQSQQAWLPVLQEPAKFNAIVKSSHQQQKFIAHCVDNTKRSLSDAKNAFLSSKIILIGPEGDFTADEIELALQNNFVPVSLGNTRLRTETAGVVAATLLQFV